MIRKRDKWLFVGEMVAYILFILVGLTLCVGVTVAAGKYRIYAGFASAIVFGALNVWIIESGRKHDDAMWRRRGEKMAKKLDEEW